MSDYEKLVKALRQCGTGDFPSCATCGVDNVTCGEIKRLRMRRAADAITELVSNADKFKWISTAERQPEESGAYLCRTAKRVYLVVNYSKRHNTWNAFDSEDEPKHALEVTHWMPISEPPEVMEND